MLKMVQIVSQVQGLISRIMHIFADKHIIRNRLMVRLKPIEFDYRNG